LNDIYIYRTTVDLDRIKLQLEKTANWYNNCVIKLVFEYNIASEV